MMVTAPMPRASVKTATSVNPGRVHECAHRVARVAPGIVQPHEGARVTLQFLHLLDAAECTPGSNSRLVRCETLCAARREGVVQLDEETPECRHVSLASVFISQCAWGPTPKRARSRARLRLASLRPLARAAGASSFFSARGALRLRAPTIHAPACSATSGGGHPRSLSLGGRPAAGFPPAPRSGRRRSSSFFLLPSSFLLVPKRHHRLDPTARRAGIQQASAPIATMP